MPDIPSVPSAPFPSPEVPDPATAPEVPGQVVPPGIDPAVPGNAIPDDPATSAEMRELARIIEAFDRSTAHLQASHDALRQRVAELSGELQQKNEELQTTLTQVSALKNYLANILESITDGVIAIDPDRRIMAFNQSAAAAVLDMTFDQMGRPIHDVLPQACEELGRLLVRALEEERGFVNVEIRLRGTPPRTLSVSASPIRNEGGEVLGAVETFRDLTELKQLEELALRKDRLAALGEMAAGVAHEIRNPLGGIELLASSLRRRFDAGSHEYGIADKIIAAATALNRIVTDMLTFTRSREPVRKPVQPGQIIHAALDMAAKTLQERGIVVDVRHAAEMPVLLDRDLLVQAGLNVILNAAQVMEPGGVLVVSTWFVVDRESRVLCMEFEDGGPGIPDLSRDKLFDPFFTTRKEGTGLGLSIVLKIVQDHGGTISVENRPPRGAAFTFRIPVPEDGDIAEPSESSAHSGHSGHPTGTGILP